MEWHRNTGDHLALPDRRQLGMKSPRALEPYISQWLPHGMGFFFHSTFFSLRRCWEILVAMVDERNSTNSRGDRGTMILEVNAACLGCTILFVILRSYTKVSVKALGADDGKVLFYLFGYFW